MNVGKQSIIAVIEQAGPMDFKNDTRMERRRSGRWPCGKELFWRVPHGRRVRRSVISERSLSGLVIAAEKEDAVPPGTFVIANDRPTRDRHGFCTAVICRTEQTANGSFLLFTDILA